MSDRRATPEPKQDARPIHLCGQELPHASHICAFFDSRKEKYDVLAPYFSEGIADGDRIINVVDERERDRHVRTLEQAHVPIRKAIEHGQFRLLTAEETYLKQGAVDLEEMLGLLRDALTTAERDGLRIRTCGEMNWIGRSGMPVENVMSYEARVNEFVPDFQCTLVCVYDIGQMRAGLVADILATHPTAIINGRLRPNPYFVEPNEFLEMLRSRKAS